MQKSFKEARVWQQAMDLIEEVYKVSRRFPKVEENGLTLQVRRVAIQAASRLAEGYARGTRGALARALTGALGALADLETQLLVAEKMKFVLGNQNEEVMKALAHTTHGVRTAFENLKKSSVKRRRPPPAAKQRPGPGQRPPPNRPSGAR